MARPMKNSGVDWLGKVPEHWKVEKLKYHVKSVNEKNLYNKGDKYIGLENINSFSGTINTPNVDYEEKLSSSFKKGDVLFNKLRPYLTKAFIADFDGYSSSELIVLRDYAGERRFLLYYLLSSQFIDVVNSSTYGTKMPRASWDFIKELQLLLPTKVEQQKIAQFLDQKTTHIDSIISDTKQSIEEFKIYKQAVITEAVTKGLNPDVAMRDSGIEWVGKIPEHWEKVKIKSLFKVINVRNYDDEKALLLSLFTAIGVKPRSEMEDKGNKNSTVLDYKIVKKGDLVVNKLLAWMGAIGYSDYDGVTSPDYDVYRAFENANVVQGYYNNYFRHTKFKDDCYKFGRGIMMMRWRTYPEQFKQIPVLNPPHDEQKEIVQYLEQKCSHIDNLILQKQQLIAELETYKKALIFEYVTGKKEVL